MTRMYLLFLAVVGKGPRMSIPIHSIGLLVMDNCIGACGFLIHNVHTIVHVRVYIHTYSEYNYKIHDVHRLMQLCMVMLYDSAMLHSLFFSVTYKSSSGGSRGQNLNLSRYPSAIPCSSCTRQGQLESQCAWSTQWGQLHVHYRYIQYDTCIWLLICVFGCLHLQARAVQPISYKALVEEWPLQCYQLLIPLCGEAVELGISGMIVVIATLGVSSITIHNCISSIRALLQLAKLYRITRMSYVLCLH